MFSLPAPPSIQVPTLSMTQSWSSKWSERTDRLEKLREYQATPSIQRYVILEQKSIGATMFTRKGEELVAAALV
jgi:hypothetical protein